jgi:eukaryotic-like serine/threonine-protein kinase
MGEAGTVAAGRRQMTLGALSAKLRKELEWVPLKAMRKDRNERYRSAAELADDVRNYQAGRALVAAPESLAYRVRKFVRRNRGPVVAAAVVLLALIAGITSTTLQSFRAIRAERLAYCVGARATERGNGRRAGAL